MSVFWSGLKGVFFGAVWGYAEYQILGPSEEWVEHTYEGLARDALTAYHPFGFDETLAPDIALAAYYATISIVGFKALSNFGWAIALARDGYNLKKRGTFLSSHITPIHPLTNL